MNAAISSPQNRSKPALDHSQDPLNQHWHDPLASFGHQIPLALQNPTRNIMKTRCSHALDKSFFLQRNLSPRYVKEQRNLVTPFLNWCNRFALECKCKEIYSCVFFFFLLSVRGTWMNFGQLYLELRIEFEKLLFQWLSINRVRLCGGIESPLEITAPPCLNTLPTSLHKPDEYFLFMQLERFYTRAKFNSAL